MIGVELLIIAVLLFLSGIFSGTEIGFYSISRVKHRYRLHRGERRARLMDRMMADTGGTLIVILIANNIVNEQIAGHTESSLSVWFGPFGSVLVTVLVMTPLLLLFGEFLPKHLFRRNADRWMYQLAYVLMAIRLLLWVPAALLKGLVRLLEWLIPGRRGEIWEPHTSRPNLRTFFHAESSGHNLTDGQKRLFDRVLVLERMTIESDAVSKPLDEVATLDARRSVAATRADLGPKFYQRYLLHDGNPRRPIGYLTAADLVLGQDEDLLATLLRELPRVPAGTPLLQALDRMHDTGTDFALVTQAGTLGPRIAFRGDCMKVLLDMD